MNSKPYVSKFLPALVAMACAYPAEVKFGASYDGTYKPDSSLAPATQSIWSRGVSAVPILPNTDGETASPGVATFNDSSDKGRVQMSLALKKAFGVNPADKEYTFTFRAKFDPDGASMVQSTPPLAVVAVGFRDEDGESTFGRSLLLGFFLDIDMTLPGLQAGLGLVDERTRLVKEIARLEFCDRQFHTYAVRKYLKGGALKSGSRSMTSC